MRSGARSLHVRRASSVCAPSALPDGRRAWCKQNVSRVVRMQEPQPHSRRRLMSPRLAVQWETQGEVKSQGQQLTVGREGPRCCRSGPKACFYSIEMHSPLSHTQRRKEHGRSFPHTNTRWESFLLWWAVLTLKVGSRGQFLRSQVRDRRLALLGSRPDVLFPVWFLGVPV